MTTEEVKDYLYATLKVLTKNTDEEIRAYIEMLETESPKMTVAELEKEIAKLKGEQMTVRHITLSDEDYPIGTMLLVEDREKYDLFKIDDLTVVPLCQVIDLMETVKPSYIKRDNKCYCPICNSEVKEGFKVPKGKIQIERRIKNDL